MILHQIRPAILALFAIACGSLFNSTSHAEQPAKVERYFIEFPWDGGVHDWEAAGSRWLVIVPNVDDEHAPSPVEFGSPDLVSLFPENFEVLDENGNLIIDLSNTVWVRATTLRISDDGVDRGRWIYWLVGSDDVDELPKPPAGARAKAGPDGEIEVLADVTFDTWTDSTLFIRPFGSDSFRLCRGLFSK